MRLTHKGDPPHTHFRYPLGMWDYTPREGAEPWRINWAGVTGIGATAGSEPFASLEAAVNQFADYWLPPWYQFQVMILDGYDTAVLGYSMMNEAIVRNPGVGWWFGVQAGYDELAKTDYQLDAAIWEPLAREAMTL